MGQSETAMYHVLLEGRQVGPYDRRTIIGMRIKNTLSSADVVIAPNGARMTVADLVQDREKAFQPMRTGSYSLVQATYTASLVEVEGKGLDIPPFKGEVEARVQRDVLRLAGRYRQAVSWKEDRVKVPLEAIAYARLRGTMVDLWLRGEPGAPLQRLTLELFTPEAAGEFVDWLPIATPWPGSDEPAAKPSAPLGAHPLTWAIIVGAVLLVGGIILWMLLRRT